MKYILFRLGISLLICSINPLCCREGELALSSSSTLTARSLLLSSDDDYKTASESGSARRESGEWGEALPPSPPLNRTPMSRVKERARFSNLQTIFLSKN